MQSVLRSSCWFFIPLLVLNACTGVSVKESVAGNRAAYQERAEKLAAIPQWGFVGRLSLDDGEQGGSGRLQWDVKPDRSELDFHAAMGRGAWRLTVSPAGATLKEANGAEQTAPGVDALIQDRMGWSIPVDALQWWVRGLAAPGSIEVEEFDPDGLLLELEQFGWNVVFDRYKSTAGVALPVRLEAVRGSYRVKLAVNRWQMDTGAAD